MDKRNYLWIVIYWFLAVVFILGELAYSGFAAVFSMWYDGMERSFNYRPLNIADIAFFAMMSIPSIYLLSLIFIAFIQMRYVRYAAMAVLFVQLCTFVFWAFALQNVQDKGGMWIMSKIFTGYSILYWFLYAAIYSVRRMCGHFKMCNS